MDEQDEWEPQPKQKKRENACIIHCSDNPGKVVLVDSLDKWNILVNAAEILHDDKTSKIVNELAQVTPNGLFPSNITYIPKTLFWRAV